MCIRDSPRARSFNLKYNTRSRKHRYLSNSADKGTKHALSNLACPQGSVQLFVGGEEGTVFIVSNRRFLEGWPQVRPHENRKPSLTPAKLSSRRQGKGTADRWGTNKGTFWFSLKVQRPLFHCSFSLLRLLFYGNLQSLQVS